MTTTELPTAKPAKKAKPLNECWCGCGGLTKNHFVPGHDSKFHSQAKQVARGQLDEATLPPLPCDEAAADFEAHVAAERPKWAAKQAEAAQKKADREAKQAAVAAAKAAVEAAKAAAKAAAATKQPETQPTQADAPQAEGTPADTTETAQPEATAA